MEAALAPIEHVDDDRYIALTRQLGGDAASAVVVAAEGGKAGCSRSSARIFSLAPEIEAPVVVQERPCRARGASRFSGWRGMPGHAGRAWSGGRGPRRESGRVRFADTSAVGMVGAGAYSRRSKPGHERALPCGQGAELRPKERERERLTNPPAAARRDTGCRCGARRHAGPAAGASVCAARRRRPATRASREVKNLTIHNRGCIADSVSAMAGHWPWPRVTRVIPRSDESEVLFTLTRSIAGCSFSLTFLGVVVQRGRGYAQNLTVSVVFCDSSIRAG